MRCASGLGTGVGAMLLAGCEVGPDFQSHRAWSERLHGLLLAHGQPPRQVTWPTGRLRLRVARTGPSR
jgi:hypothetical protein